MKSKNTEAFRILVKLFGDKIVAETKILQKQEPEFADAILDYAISKVWARKGLSLKERSMITISSQAAMGRWDQVEHHAQSFLRLGGKTSELREIFLHLSVYCGFPVTRNGLEILMGLKANTKKRNRK